MSDAVRALDPTAPPPENGAPPPPEEPGRRRWLAAIGGGVAAVTVIVTLIQPSSPPGPPPLEPVEPTVPIALSRPSYPAPSVDVFERFVTLIDQGDGGEALTLMVDELPDILGVGTAEYPQLPSDANWWTDGLLDRDNVAQLARYVHTVPGSVSVTDCKDFADGPRVVVVRCAYTSTGGALAPLGLDREEGRLFGIMIDRRVAGLIRNGADQREIQLWHRLADWAAESRPAVQLRAPILGGAGWKLDPVYSSTSAHEHQALALELAALTQERDQLRY